MSRFLPLAQAEKAKASGHPESEYGQWVVIGKRKALGDGLAALFASAYAICPRKGDFFMGSDGFSKCHPLTNFVFFLGAIGFAVVIQHPAYIAVSVLSGAAYYLLLKGRKGISMVLGMVPVFVALSAVNPLFNQYGQRVLFTVFGRMYTLEALLYGMAIAGIFVAMLLWFSCYSHVLTSDKFVCLFGSLIPALSLLLVMVLRLIPNLMRKASQIAGARRCVGKGAGEQSAAKDKVLDGMNVLSALTDWALEGSIVTADSMRSRGYGAAKRTSFQIYRLSGLDGMLLALEGLLAVAVIAAGGMGASFTPVLTIEQPGFGLVAYGLYLCIPILLELQEVLRWKIALSKI